MKKTFNKKNWVIDVVFVLLAIVLAYFTTTFIVGLYFSFWEGRLIGAAALGLFATSVGLLLIPITFVTSLTVLIGVYVLACVRKRP